MKKQSLILIIAFASFTSLYSSESSRNYSWEESCAVVAILASRTEADHERLTKNLGYLFHDSYKLDVGNNLSYALAIINKGYVNKEEVENRFRDLTVIVNNIVRSEVKEYALKMIQSRENTLRQRRVIQ